MVNHRLVLKDPETGAHTNGIERTWSAVKRGLNRNRVKDTLHLHLCEYMWRKRQAARKAINPFLDFLDAVIRVYPPHVRDSDGDKENEK